MPHTSHCTLHTYTPPFISSELFSPYPSSSLLISSLLICHLSFHESLPSTTSRTCLRRAPARPVRACFVRSCCSVAVQEHDLRATPVHCNAKQHFPHTSHCALHAPHSTLHTCTSSQLISSELVSSHFMSSHLSAKFFLAIFMSSERGSTFLISPKLVSTHLGSSARQKAWDTDAFTQKGLYKILCTTKLAQSTSQYNLVLRSLHRVLPSSTLYTRLEETPFTSSHLFVTHFNSSVCQKNW